MSAGNLSRTVIAILVVAGVLTIAWRYHSRISRVRATAGSRWQLTYRVRLRTAQPSPSSRGQPAGIPDDYVVRMALPQNSSQIRMISEEIIHPSLPETASIYFGSRTDTRLWRLSTTRVAECDISAEFELEKLPSPGAALDRRPTLLSGTARSRFTGTSDAFPVTFPAVQRRLTEAPKDVSDNELLQWVFDYCALRLDDWTESSEGVADDVKKIVEYNDANALGRARTFVTLCRGVRRTVNRRIVTGFPARLVTGFELRQSADARPLVWAEVFHEHRWIPFDPASGYAFQLPDQYLPIRYGGNGLVWQPGQAEGQLAWGEGINVENVSYAISRLPPPPQLLAADQPRITEIFDLSRLPVEMHTVLKLMLLLPLAALITCIFRNIVGIRTFGTFAPALLALSFIYAAWTSGLVILVFVLTSSLTGRTFVERMHLLMVPRLSVILTLIILCIVLSVSWLDYRGSTPSAQAVLLPMVILTTLTERLFVTTEEDGPTYAVQLAIGTLVVAAFCYMALRWDDVGNLILVYPEIHLITVAVFVALGRYTGYRLTELWRFRDLLQTDEQK